MLELVTFPRTITVEGGAITVANAADSVQKKQWFATEIARLQQQRRGDPFDPALMKKLLVALRFLEALIELEEQQIEAQRQEWLAEDQELDQQINELITPILYSGGPPPS